MSRSSAPSNRPGRRWFRLVTLALMGAGGLAAAGPHLGAQAPSSSTSDRSTVGLLVVAHGAGPGWNSRVHQLIRMIDWDGPIGLAFLMGDEAHRLDWARGVAELTDQGATEVIAVPLMVNSHGAHVHQIEYYAGELDSFPAVLESMRGMMEQRSTNPVPVFVTPALDGAPELGSILLHRLRELPARYCSGSLMLIAHGPNSPDQVPSWLTDLGSTIAPIGDSIPGTILRVGLLRDDAGPAIRAAAVTAIRDTILAIAERTGDSVTVMTALISSGSIDRIKIPDDLANLPIRYAPTALAPHPLLASWVVRIADSVRVDRKRLANQNGANPHDRNGQKNLH